MSTSHKTRAAIEGLPGKVVKPWEHGDPRCHCTHCDLCCALFRTADIGQHETECQAALLAVIERDRVSAAIDAWCVKHQDGFVMRAWPKWGGGGLVESWSITLGPTLIASMQRGASGDTADLARKSVVDSFTETPCRCFRCVGRPFDPEVDR